MDLAFVGCAAGGPATPLRARAPRRAASSARPAVVAPALRMRHGAEAGGGVPGAAAASPATTPAAAVTAAAAAHSATSPALVVDAHDGSAAAAAAGAAAADAKVTLVVAPAIAPRQRPRESQAPLGGHAGHAGHVGHGHAGHGHYHTEAPAARSADVMAPRREGIWAVLPYVAAAAVVGFGGWVAQKKVRSRHAQLVADFGATLSAYGASDRAAGDIVADYKGKVGPGVDRKGLYRSGLAALITDIPAGVSLIRRATALQRALGIKDAAAAAEINTLAEDQFATQPSLLGKLIFVSERVVGADVAAAAALRLRPMLPYSEEVVETLQRDMAARILAAEVDAAADRGAGVPAEAASLLRVSAADAAAVYDAALERRAAKAAAAAEAAATAAAEATTAASDAAAGVESADAAAAAAAAAEEEAAASSSAAVDKDAHVYECGGCGYTLYPAKGREFRFFPDSFKCPMCGAPKDQFTDINA